MNNEEEFKESLRKLVESKEFTFDESDWEKARGVIYPNEKTGGKRALLAIAALLLLSGGILLYYYLTPANKPVIASKPVTIENKEQNTAETSDLKPTVNERTITTNNTNPLPAQTPGAVKLHEEPAIEPKTNPAGSLNTAITAPEKETPAPAPTQHVKAINTPASEEKNSTASSSAPINQDNAIVPNGKSQNIPAAKAGIPVVSPLAAQSYTNEITGNNIPGKQQALIPAEKEKANTTTDVTEPVASQRTRSNEPGNTVITPQTTEETVQLPVKPVQLPLVETDAQLMASMITEAVLPPLPEKLVMSFEAGANYLLGWKNPGQTEANGFNPVVGFNYYNYVSRRFVVSFGAQYTSVGNLGYSNHTSAVTRYNLGEEKAVTVITPEKMHYLLVPLKLNYLLNDKNAVGIGVNVAYLLAVDSKEETYNQRINSTQENYKLFKTTGYNEGFAAFDTQLSLFYRRKIYKNISVNAEVMYGLTDIKNNTFFNSGVSEHNKGIKLTLLYNLFR